MQSGSLNQRLAYFRLKLENLTINFYCEPIEKVADDFIESCEKVGYRPFDALKDIQNIDYSWGEIEFEVTPMNRLMKSCAPVAACADSSYDLDIEPDDIEVSDTVTVVWEIG